MNRSLAGQIEHWAAIGRAIEQSPEFSYARIRQALSARLSYDDLNAAERIIVQRELIDELKQPIAPAEIAQFAAELRASGVSYSGTDERYPGYLVSVRPDGRRLLLKPEGEGHFVVARELPEPGADAGRAEAGAVADHREQRGGQDDVLLSTAQAPAQPALRQRRRNRKDAVA
jgi:hypothetical protein